MNSQDDTTHGMSACGASIKGLWCLDCKEAVCLLGKEEAFVKPITWTELPECDNTEKVCYVLASCGLKEKAIRAVLDIESDVKIVLVEGLPGSGANDPSFMKDELPTMFTRYERPDLIDKHCRRIGHRRPYRYHR